MKKFSLIAACDKVYGIGVQNQLPWNLPSELKYFSSTTKNTTVIMGRKTWESLPQTYRPLPNRQNIVLSSRSDLNLPENVFLANSLDQALKHSTHETIFVIGGASLYKESIQHPNCEKVYLTTIQSTFNCDTFFPGDYLKQNFVLASHSSEQEENGHKFTFNIYSRKEE